MRKHLHLILLLALISLTATAHSVVEWDGYYEVKHSWKCNGRECSITLNVSTNLYDYYRNDREHLAYKYRFDKDETEPNYYGFMLSEHDRPVIRSLAHEFYDHAASEEESILLALTFVQSLPYSYDSDSKGEDEYMRYPVETLVDGCGDCEDKVALLVALLYEMDMDFVLLVLPEHMAVGVHCDEIDLPRYLLFQGKKYYFLETTMPNWGIGDIPENYRSSEIEVVPVDAMPSLLIKGVKFESQEALVYEKADCEVQLDLHNLGPGKVTGLEVAVRIIEKGKRNRLLAEDYYSLVDLQEGEQRTEHLFFKSRIKENCLIQVELSGWEVTAQYYEMELGYNRIRR
ncbi:MAG: hypothetical protein IKO23_11830 [Bacteroidales bacterium]|nr:hypothetical protein [Bacteroidales bacterium]